MRKRLSKDIASFDYFDKSLIVFSVTAVSISTALFATAFWNAEALINNEINRRKRLSRGERKN